MIDPPSDLIALMCHRFAKFNLVAMLEYLGNEKFQDFIDRFSGCYVKVPSAKKLFNVYDHYRLNLIFTKLKATPKKDVLAWEKIERQFLAEVKRMHLKEPFARQLCTKIRRDIQEAREWLNGLRDVAARQNRSEL